MNKQLIFVKTYKPNQTSNYGQELLPVQTIQFYIGPKPTLQY